MERRAELDQRRYSRQRRPGPASSTLVITVGVASSLPGQPQQTASGLSRETAAKERNASTIVGDLFPF